MNSQPKSRTGLALKVVLGISSLSLIAGGIAVYASVKGLTSGAMP